MPNQEPVSAEFLEIVRWESVPRGSFARTWKLSSCLFSRPDWLPLGLRGWPTRQDSVGNRDKVYSKFFKLSLSLSFTHLIGSNCLYELKGDLSPVMLKEIFHDSFENFEITRICIENHASVTGWQKLFSHKCLQLLAAVAITTFEIYGGEFSGYLILICSFSLYWQNFSEVNCFRVYRKLITWSSHAKNSNCRKTSPKVQ